jgi:hypothetical protein
MAYEKKTCRTCKDEKSIDDFWRYPNSCDGRYLDCKKCAYEKQKENLAKRLIADPLYSNKRQKEWRERGRNSLKHNLKQKYGITLEQYDAMLMNQDGKCPICDGNLGEKHRIAIDHDHKTGKVRELLHFRCNQGIGFFLDSPQLLRKAAEYLERHGKV